ncbi:hypothetical protein CRG98_035163, partial [Punica granatum]
MAAITNAPVLPRPPVRASKLSALYLTPSRVPCGLIKRNVASSASRLSLLPPIPGNPAPPEKVRFFGETLNQPPRRRVLVDFPICPASADGGELKVSDGFDKPSKSFAERYPALITGFFFFMWYFLNVIFNILNKKVYNYFPYPYFVSLVHLLVGVVYCLVSWAVGLPKRAPIDKELLLLLTPVAFCHALGHVMSNVSFAAVAVSFTHTIKALEPFFNAAASQFVLGHQIPFSLWLSLAPVVI